MHGIILVELKRYVETTLGDAAWKSLLAEVGLTGKVYLAFQDYPDAEILGLVAAIARTTGKPVDVFWEEFGRFIVPWMMRLFGALLDESWKTLEVIENTEATIHRVVRLHSPGAKPGELRCHRPNPNEVVVTYVSPRRLCALARGISRGLAHHFSETVEITETGCARRGAPACEITVRRV